MVNSIRKGIAEQFYFSINFNWCNFSTGYLLCKKICSFSFFNERYTKLRILMQVY